MSKKLHATHLMLQLNAINVDKTNQVRISPIDLQEGIDGRVFDINGEELLEKIKATGLELPLTKAHEWGGEALGWFNNFALKDDGIYADLTLNEVGKELIKRKAYKYLSPEYLTKWDGDKNIVVVFHGVGLVNKPNLLNEALNESQQPQPPKEGNTMTDIEKQEFEKLKTDNNALQEDKAALEKDKQTLQVQLNTQNIDTAIASGDLLPAKRVFALTLNANSLEAFLKGEKEATPKIANNSLNPDGDNGAGAANDIERQLGLDED